MEEAGVRGSILLAAEGVNGTIAGPVDGLESVFRRLREQPGFHDLQPKLTPCNDLPFGKAKVRLKREIVALRHPVNMADVGTYVEPMDWNRLINDSNTVVVDARNGFEVALGKFPGAIDPNTKHFSELPAFLAQRLTEWEGKRVAMYCTGGIRCEKATAWLRANGVSEVFHLKGGILGYLETVPPEDSLWEGECFVFDERVSVSPEPKESEPSN
jgi:UPF0176 protein